jgi:hypothetical protein
MIDATIVYSIAGLFIFSVLGGMAWMLVWAIREGGKHERAIQGRLTRRAEAEAEVLRAMAKRIAQR